MSSYLDTNPFWVERRKQFLASMSASADPAACGTCRGLAEAGEPVKHDECQQRATLLQAPDHPDYEILAGFSLEENAKLPARFHIPVFDDCGKPNAWLCAVCWEDGVVTGWPCKTATEQGTKVFSPVYEAETAAKKQAARIAELEAEAERLKGRLGAVLDICHVDVRTEATPGEAAEYRHLLYDADADATVPAFPYPTPLEAP